MILDVLSTSIRCDDSVVGRHGVSNSVSQQQLDDVADLRVHGQNG